MSGPSPNSHAADQQLRPPLRTRIWSGTKQRLHRTVATVRHRPLDAAGLIVGFLLRWVLRVGLPIAGAAAMLHLFPYRTVAGGIHFRIEGTLLTRPGISADTTIGNWLFPHVTGLPVGVHVTPERVDVVHLAQVATEHGASYVDGLQADIQRQVPAIIAWLLGEVVVGVLLGLLVAVAVNLSVRYLRRRPHHRHELRLRLLQLGAALVVLGMIAGYGALTYNPRWAHTSRVTGTLAALQLFPGQLQQYYQQSSKATDVAHAIAGIQASLQQNIDPPVETSFNVMFISDMHLAATYPLVVQYAANFDVKLIINTGDEAEFGTAAEMTPTYLDQLKALTATVPMIWVAGNHDSPTTVQIMRQIPGVIVLGTKEANGEDGITVTAEQVNAYGLKIAGVPDPRVYGGPGIYGSDTTSVVDKLEKHAVDQAVKEVPKTAYFDIFATHEPVAADELVAQLPDQIRQTNAGHTHKQNKNTQIQRNGQPITLVEGSTGAGGLDRINTKSAVPIEFSIESVAANCQFTKLVRFQIKQDAPSSSAPAAIASSRDVSAATIDLSHQKVAADRECRLSQGIGAPDAVG